MAFYTWGGGDDPVVIAPSGGVLGGRKYWVYTVKNGTRITALTDHAGTSIGNEVTSNSEGRLQWRINAQTWPTVWLYHQSTDNWWGPFLANEVLPQVPAAIANAAAALTVATQAATALGEITMPLSSHATAAQLNGTADVGPALQAAGYALPAGGGRVTAPAGSVLWFSGSTVCKLRSNVTIDLLGAVVTKTSGSGIYTCFVAHRVSNIKIVNGYFQGDLASGGSMCVLASNRGSNITVEKCEMVGCVIGGHAFDLGGVNGFRITDCIFRGYSPSTGAPRAEAIQLDISSAGALSFGDPGQCDGSMTRNVWVEDCQFLPLTVGGVTYPAPNPVGAHASHEGHRLENIHLSNLVVVDPVSDPADTGYGDNGYIRGVFHFTPVKNFHASGVRIVATTPRTIRAFHFQSLSTGSLDSSDWNTGGTNGTYETPTISEDIFLREIVIEGLTPAGGESATLNPVIVTSGVTGGNIRNVNIDATVKDCGGPGAIVVQKADGVNVTIHGDNLANGVVLNSCVNVEAVTGSTRQVVKPVTLDDTDDFTIGPFVAKHSSTQTAVVTYTNTPTGGSLIGIRKNGFTNHATGTSSGVVTAGNS